MSTTIEKAPSRGMESGPIGRQATNNNFTIGGAAVASRPVIGWEAITPNTHNKPKFLIEAQAARDEAWSDYLWLIDNKPENWAAQTEAWDRYEAAERKARACYRAYCDGFDYEPIPY